MEIGDNLADRKLLTDPNGRERIASILTEALGPILADIDF
jgi:hypothetical protein